MVWQDVLPVNIYCRAMGTLLNTALGEIVARITALEVRTVVSAGGGASVWLGFPSCPASSLGIHGSAFASLMPLAVSGQEHFSAPLQDISAENADRLHALCQTMVDEGPQVFVPLPEEKENRRFQEEVPVYVPKWLMFKELMLVLQASLQEIVDRWVFSQALPGVGCQV